MITQDELEMFLDSLIAPTIDTSCGCGSDACPIDFGDRSDVNK